MSNNERNEKLHRSFDLIEDEFIVEASPQSAKPMTSIINRRIKRLAFLAACICIVAGIAISPFSYIFNKNNVPVSNMIYSAEQVGDFFGGSNLDGATKAYTQVFVPDEKYLYIDALTTEKYLTVYEMRNAGKAIDEEEFHDFIFYVLPKLCAEMNVDVPAYETKRINDSIATLASLENMHFSQDSTSRDFHLYHLPSSDLVIEVDKRKSDAEIIQDLEPIKEKLFYIFGTEFSDIKILRDYNQSGSSVDVDIYVYFYDSDAHPLNNHLDTPVSDYIALEFDGSLGYMGENTDEDIISDVSIRYTDFMSDPYARYVPVKKLKAISLEDAEELLYKGYVFGGHSCTLCMQEQAPVDFKDYDHVDLEYVRGFNDMEILPFYAFYKYTGDADNGNKIYAKTYVPAIKVSGYEKYFEEQEKYHRASAETPTE